MRQAALVKATGTVLQWTAQRGRLRAGAWQSSSGRHGYCHGVVAGLGEPVPGGEGDHRVPREATCMGLGSQCSMFLTGSRWTRRPGWYNRRGLSYKSIIRQANTSGAEQSACVADGAGAEEVAFAAGFAAAEKKLRKS